jgi:HSP20 family molecular chaperone IbpA
MSDNTARAMPASITRDPESDRPTVVPGMRLASSQYDTAEVDAAWPEDAPRHSLVARRGIYGRVESGTSERTMDASAPRTVEYDVYEDARVLLVLIDMPGVAPETLAIHLSNVALHVSASTPDDPKRQCPLQAGRHELVIDVPRGTEAEAVDASLRNGVLRVRIAKPDAAARRVDIVGSEA